MAGVEIRENLPLKGRGLYATQDHAEGAVLFEEKPLVCAQFLWNAKCKYLACDHCLRSLETAQEQAQRLAENPSIELPYPDCCEVDKQEYVQCPQCEIWYCSSECRDTALEQYHYTLCLGANRTNPKHPINKLTEMWKDIHHPPETTSITLILRMIAMVKQAKDKEAMVQRFSQFCSAIENEHEGCMHKLLGKDFENILEMVREELQNALYLEDLQQWFTPQGIRSLFAMIGTNGQGLGTSTLSLWSKKVETLELPEAEKEKLEAFLDTLYMMLDETAGEFLNVEGSALYSLQSACNHDCSPNAEVSYPHNNSTLQLRTLKPIKQGEEICISYLDPCELERSRHSRQKHLRENYLFTCMCSRCQSQADDLDETSEEEMDEDEESDDDVVTYGQNAEEEMN